MPQTKMISKLQLPFLTLLLDKYNKCSHRNKKYTRIHIRWQVIKYYKCIHSFLKNYFTVVQLQLSEFSPCPSPRPHPNPTLSLASTLPLDFAHVSFMVFPENPSPYCHLPLPCGYCQLFLTSMTLVIFCLLACLLIRFH